jgi:hypothetical protein
MCITMITKGQLMSQATGRAWTAIAQDLGLGCWYARGDGGHGARRQT